MSQDRKCRSWKGAGVDYVFGFAKNTWLKRATERWQLRSRSRGLASGKELRRYRDFRHRTLANSSRHGSSDGVLGPLPANRLAWIY